MSKTRELIISPKVSQAQLSKFLPQLEEEGIKMVYLDPKKLGIPKQSLKPYFPLLMQSMSYLKKIMKKSPEEKKLVENLKFYQIKILRMF